MPDELGGCLDLLALNWSRGCIVKTFGKSPDALTMLLFLQFEPVVRSKSPYATMAHVITVAPEISLLVAEHIRKTANPSPVMKESLFIHYSGIGLVHQCLQ